MSIRALRGGARRTRAMDGDLDDAELISRVRRGDHDAYTALYRRHVDAAHRLARACCRSVQDADDVTAEVFAAVLAAIVHGKGPTDSFRPYLLRSIRNECAHVGRSRAGAILHVDVLAEQSADESAAVSSTELRAALSTEDRDLEVADERRLVGIAMRALPEHYRSMLWLTEVENRSHEQIGRARGMSPASVATTALRARRAFCRAFLEAHVGGGARAEGTSERSGACGRVQRLLPAVVRGECSPRRMRVVADHLATCEQCSSTHRELCEVNSMLRHTPLGIVLAGPAAFRWFGSAGDATAPATAASTTQLADVTTIGNVPAAGLTAGNGTLAAKLTATIGAFGARAAAVLVLTSGAGAATVAVVDTARGGGQSATADVDSAGPDDRAPTDEPSVAPARRGGEDTADATSSSDRGAGSGAGGAAGASGSPADDAEPAGDLSPVLPDDAVPPAVDAGAGVLPDLGTVPPALGSGDAGTVVSLPGVGVGVGGDSTTAVTVDLDELGVGQVIDDVAGVTAIVPVVGEALQDIVSNIDTTIEVTVPPITVPPITVPPITTPPISTPPLSIPLITVPSVTVPPISLPPATVPPLDSVIGGLLGGS